MFFSSSRAQHINNRISCGIHLAQFLTLLHSWLSHYVFYIKSFYRFLLLDIVFCIHILFQTFHEVINYKHNLPFPCFSLFLFFLQQRHKKSNTVIDLHSTFYSVYSKVTVEIIYGTTAKYKRAKIIIIIIIKKKRKNNSLEKRTLLNLPVLQFCIFITNIAAVQYLYLFNHSKEERGFPFIFWSNKNVSIELYNKQHELKKILSLAMMIKKHMT